MSEKRNKVVDLRSIATELERLLLIKLVINEEKAAFDFTNSQLTLDDLSTFLFEILKKSNGNCGKVIDWSLVPTDLKHRRNIIISYVKETEAYVVSDTLFHGLPITQEERKKFKLYLVKLFIKNNPTYISEVDFTDLDVFTEQDILSVVTEIKTFYLKYVKWDTIQLPLESICNIFCKIGWVNCDVMRMLGATDETLQPCQDTVLKNSSKQINELKIDWSLVEYSEKIEKKVMSAVFEGCIIPRKIPMQCAVKFSVKNLTDILLHIAESSTRNELWKFSTWEVTIDNCSPDIKSKCLMVAAHVLNREIKMNAYFQNIVNWDIVVLTPEILQSIFLYGYNSLDVFKELPLIQLYGSRDEVCKQWALAMKTNFKVVALLPCFSDILTVSDMAEILKVTIKGTDKYIQYIMTLEFSSEDYFFFIRSLLQVSPSYISKITWSSLAYDQLLEICIYCCKNSAVRHITNVTTLDIDVESLILQLLPYLQTLDDVVEISKFPFQASYDTGRKIMAIFNEKGGELQKANILYQLRLSIADRETLIVEQIKELYKAGKTDNELKLFGLQVFKWDPTVISAQLFLDLHVRLKSIVGVFKGFFEKNRQNREICLCCIAVNSVCAREIPHELTCDEILDQNSNAFCFYPNSETLVRDNQDKVVATILRKHKHSADIDISTKCVICLAEFEESDVPYIYTRCLHAYCVSCIQQWTMTNTYCPLCRTPL